VEQFSEDPSEKYERTLSASIMLNEIKPVFSFHGIVMYADFIASSVKVLEGTDTFPIETEHY